MERVGQALLSVLYSDGDVDSDEGAVEEIVEELIVVARLKSLGGKVDVGWGVSSISVLASVRPVFGV